MPAELDLTGALQVIVGNIEAAVRASGYAGTPIVMCLAGGLAMHYYARGRYTHDIDASFSHRLILPVKELTATFRSADG